MKYIECRKFDTNIVYISMTLEPEDTINDIASVSHFTARKLCAELEEAYTTTTLEPYNTIKDISCCSNYTAQELCKMIQEKYVKDIEQ